MTCTLNATGWDIGHPCGACDHHALLHPGPGGTTECLACALTTRIDELDRLTQVIRDYEDVLYERTRL